MKTTTIYYFLFIIVFGFASCRSFDKEEAPRLTKIQKKVAEYQDYNLTANLSGLSKTDKQMIPYLLKAADVIDEIYWEQTCHNKGEFINTIDDPDVLKFFKINYGPWDRLDGNKLFITNVHTKPLGAGFYPTDMTVNEFNSIDNPKIYDLYTVIVRKEKGKLKCIPYHEMYKEKLLKASLLLDSAANICTNESFKKYLHTRSQALKTDNYSESDKAWMQLEDNNLDLIIGPIQDLEDLLFRSKKTYEAILLVKDIEWTKKIEKYLLLVPFLQTELPVDAKFKSEQPVIVQDVGVYNVIYNTGYSNAGSKLIAVNLPTNDYLDETIGNRKLYFKNIIHAKFDYIVQPISNLVIDASQRENVTYDAFFQNSIFWEIANALGINNTINGKGSVKDALKVNYHILENCKSDLLSLYFITHLSNLGKIDINIKNNYATYMASIFRSVRFGATDAQGKANMILFYYMEEKGAFVRNHKDGTYLINYDVLQKSVNELAAKIIEIQGTGDYSAAKAMVQKYGFIREELYQDLVRIAKSNIPKDINYIQGVDQLEL